MSCTKTYLRCLTSTYWPETLHFCRWLFLSKFVSTGTAPGVSRVRIVAAEIAFKFQPCSLLLVAASLLPTKTMGLQAALHGTANQADKRDHSA